MIRCHVTCVNKDWSFVLHGFSFWFINRLMMPSGQLETFLSSSRRQQSYITKIVQVIFFDLHRTVFHPKLLPSVYMNKKKNVSRWWVYGIKKGHMIIIKQLNKREAFLSENLLEMLDFVDIFEPFEPIFRTERNNPRVGYYGGSH